VAAGQAELEGIERQMEIPSEFEVTQDQMALAEKAISDMVEEYGNLWSLAGGDDEEGGAAFLLQRAKTLTDADAIVYLTGKILDMEGQDDAGIHREARTLNLAHGGDGQPRHGEGTWNW